MSVIKKNSILSRRMLAGRINGDIVIQQIKILSHDTLRRSSGRSRHIAATLSICEINLTI